MKLIQKKLFVSLACLLSLIVLVGSAFATNLVINGDFESGNSGFSSAYRTGSMEPPGVYVIGNNPINYNAWASFGPEEGELMMIVNGGECVMEVWGQTVSVESNTTYSFSAWVASSSPVSPTILDISINNTPIGSITASSTVGVWEQFTATWNSGSNTTAALAFFNKNIDYNGNDFCLDSITMNKVNPVPRSLPGIVFPLLLQND